MKAGLSMLGRLRTNNLELLSAMLHGGGLLVTLAIFALAYTGGYRPLESELRRIRQQEADAARIVANADRIRAETVELRQAALDVERRTRRLMQRIPNTPQESDFLAQLTKLAQQTQLEIRDYRPGVITDKETHSQMEVRLTAHGSYGSICRFLARLTDLSRLSRMAELKIQTAPSPQVGNSMVTTLQIYFAPKSDLLSRTSGKAKKAGNTNG